MYIGLHAILALAAAAAVTTSAATSDTREGITSVTVTDRNRDRVGEGEGKVDKFEKHLGFGVQHLKQRQHGHRAVRVDSCANVTELRFTQGVQDNFAAVEQQSPWVGEGQRYWLNEELWGGEGFPIFVFIGGERD
jgi:hypothetical protein